VAERIVVLTGAGISAESGLPTFRGPGGLWEGHRVEDVATPQAFRKNPQLVLAFYSARRRALLDAAVAPNAAHLALAQFERRTSAAFTLVTQNVDNLHERAGSAPWHMHGELLRTLCARCGHEFPSAADLAVADVCPACGRAGGLRPAVVWFGEFPLRMEEVDEALGRCDLFVAIGTSGQVYPAAGFVEIARAAGARTVEINAESTAASPNFERLIRGPASRAVPGFLAELA